MADLTLSTKAQPYLARAASSGVAIARSLRLEIGGRLMKGAVLLVWMRMRSLVRDLFYIAMYDANVFENRLRGLSFILRFLLYSCPDSS